MNNTIFQASLIDKPTSGLFYVYARLSWISAASGLLALALLHLISPEFDPSWRMVSEYALGDYQWVLTIMFVALAVSCLALGLALSSQSATRWGKIGLGLLFAAAVGLTMGGAFDVEHNLHGLATLIGIPSLTIAPLLITPSLVRHPTWAARRRLLWWTANLPWIFLVTMVAAMFIGLSQTGGEMGPDVLIGWPNRLLIMAWGLWLMLVAWQAFQMRHHPN